MIFPPGEKGEILGRVRFAAVLGACHGELGAVDPIAMAKEHNDVAIEHIPACIERQTGVGTEVDSVGSYRGRKGQVDSGPAGATVRGRIAAHRKTEYFVRSTGYRVRISGIQCDEGLALRTALIRDVNIGSDHGRGVCYARCAAGA